MRSMYHTALTRAVPLTLGAVGAQGDNQLHAVNAETGATIFTSATLGPVMRFNAPIAAKGRVYVAGNAAAYAFTVR
ncbi:MAG TPA: hypothetical protein VII08_17875 [Myxococcales bacterium]